MWFSSFYQVENFVTVWSGSRQALHIHVYNEKIFLYVGYIFLGIIRETRPYIQSVFNFICYNNSIYTFSILFQQLLFSLKSIILHRFCIYQFFNFFWGGDILLSWLFIICINIDKPYIKDIYFISNVPKNISFYQIIIEP